MQVVNGVIVILVLASLIGTTWTFVATPTGNTSEIDSSIMTILKLLPLFLVIGGLLYAVKSAQGGKQKL
jgi:uncharacterized membrane protein